MDCASLIFSGHAIERMFARAISTDDVRAVIERGELVASYPDDRPFPSFLLLGFSGARPIHVVVGYDEPHKLGYVVTAYEPDPARWEADFKRRRLP